MKKRKRKKNKIIIIFTFIILLLAVSFILYKSTLNIDTHGYQKETYQVFKELNIVDKIIDKDYSKTLEKVINSENNKQIEYTLHNDDTNVENKTQDPSVAKEQYTENDKIVINISLIFSLFNSS